MVRQAIRVMAALAFVVAVSTPTCAMNPILQQRLSSVGSALVSLGDRAVTNSVATRHLRLRLRGEERFQVESEQKGQANTKGFMQLLQGFCAQNGNFPFDDPNLNCKAKDQHLEELAALLALDVLDDLSICRIGKDEKPSPARDALHSIEGQSSGNGDWTLTFFTQCVVIELQMQFKDGRHPYKLLPLDDHDVDGKKPTIYIDGAHKLTPIGIDCGKYVFSTYFWALKERGVLALNAVRNDGSKYVGYNVWPRYGFDAPLKGKPIELLQQGLEQLLVLKASEVELAAKWLQEKQDARFSTIFEYVEDDTAAQIKETLKDAWKTKGSTVRLYFDATEQGQVATLKRLIVDREKGLATSCPPD